MQPHRVLTVYMTGQPDIFFGSRDRSHLFLGLEKICVFWGFTNIQAIFLLPSVDQKIIQLNLYSDMCEHKRG